MELTVAVGSMGVEAPLAATVEVLVQVTATMA